MFSVKSGPRRQKGLLRMRFKFGDKVLVEDQLALITGVDAQDEDKPYHVRYFVPEGFEGAWEWLREDELEAHVEVPASPAVTNQDPKKAFGATKPDLALVPPVGTLHQAMAHELGAEKYGAYNWRKDPVEAMTYIGAIGRHLQAYLDGESYTSDTLFEKGDLLGIKGLEGDEELGMVHNLGAIMASCAILLDSMELGLLIDNRPPKGRASAVQTRLQAFKKAKAARQKE